MAAAEIMGDEELAVLRKQVDAWDNLHPEDVGALLRDRDHWKARAIAAESRLASLTGEVEPVAREIIDRDWGMLPADVEIVRARVAEALRARDEAGRTEREALRNVLTKARPIIEAAAQGGSVQIAAGTFLHEIDAALARKEADNG